MTLKLHPDLARRRITTMTFLVAAAIACLAFGFTPWGHAILAKWNTSYAPGYSRSAFDQLSVGATRQQVVEAVGAPLEQNDLWSGEATELVFSRPKRDGDYELVRVWIGKDQKVRWLQQGPTD